MKRNEFRTEFTNEQLAYLAGIIDGEGSIYIGCYSHNPKTGTPHYQTKIEVSNTSETLIDWLIANFQGNKTKYLYSQLPKNSKRDVYRWTIWSDHVGFLCQAMLPYLIIKKREAEIMIEIRKTYDITHTQKGHQGLVPIKQSVLDDRARLYKEIKALHIR